MAERYRSERVEGGGAYFAAPNTSVEFIPTGCKVLDLALGGGWAENRISNVVGDKSTGKTLLMIEACANFAIKYPKGKIRYRESESAFDQEYAKVLGMPISSIDFGPPLETVEDLFEDLERCTNQAKGPELYILDSLDALSDRAELGRNFDEGSYGTAKAKNLSQMFRRLVRKIADNTTFIIVSQVRSKIGVSFGRHTTRSGGRALDFYASQVLYLSQLGMVHKTVNGIKRPVGVSIRAKVDKNKIGLPFREAEFDIRFGYGIDDALASLSWLKEIKRLGDAGLIADNVSSKFTSKMTLDELHDLHVAVEKVWYEVEQSFMPTRKKYGG